MAELFIGTFILMTIIAISIHDPKLWDLCNKMTHHNGKAFSSSLCYFITKLS